MDDSGWDLIVNVTPVNDIPMVKVMWANGTEVDQVEYVWNETTNITVWEVTTKEDMAVEFGFYYMDVETDEPASILIYTDLMHGELPQFQIRHCGAIASDLLQTYFLSFPLILHQLVPRELDASH